MKSWNRWLVVVISLAFVAPWGCAEPKAVRDTEKEDLDEHTMSVRLDRRDVNRLFEENVDKLLGSEAYRAWERQAAADTPVVLAVYPMRNETEQEVDSALSALLAKFEHTMVGQAAVDVVSFENNVELIDEIKKQRSTAYDSEKVADVGKQMGAQYFITGKFFGNLERVEDVQRMQYFVQLQVIEIETADIVFQNTSAVEPSKGEL